MDAQARFSSALLKQLETCKEAFGQPPSLKLKRLGNTFIGQIHYEPGVLGWDPWMDFGDTGITWDGVCEDFLGKKTDAREALKIINILDSQPEKISAWEGMFAVAAWHENRVIIATAAAACPTLWHTEGKHGWAWGPKAGPLLEFTGQQPLPDKASLNLFLNYGYFLGGHSPFRNVSRLDSRLKIVLENGEKPRTQSYISVGELLEGAPEGAWDKKVSEAAGIIVRRVEAQLKHSDSPVVLLTGGRESRSIVAAAGKTGLPFATTTGGPENSEDVKLASQVAKTLKIGHGLSGGSAEMDLICRTTERLKLWARVSEGVLPLNYCLHLTDYLASRLPYPGRRRPVLHGSQPGIGRGLMYRDIEGRKLQSMTLREARNVLVQKNPYLKPEPEADNQLQAVFAQVDSACEGMDVTADQWLDLFYIMKKSQIWGLDVQSMYAPVRWAWMPLYDKQVMRLGWKFTTEQKKSDRFFLEIAEHIQPSLKGIMCTGRDPVRVKLADRIKGRVTNMISGAHKKEINRTDGGIRNLWNNALLGRNENMWQEFIDRKDILKLINISPQNALLWRLVTVDFLAESFF